MSNSFTGSISRVNTLLQGTRIDNSTLNFGRKQSISDKWTECISALGSTSPFDDRNSLIESNPIGEETRQWILDKDVFRRWKEDENHDQRLIWVCDRRGLSKTALAIFVSQHLEESIVMDDSYWVLYFFCDGQNENRNTAASILRGFIYLLYDKQMDFFHNNDSEEATNIIKDFSLLRQALQRQGAVQILWRIFRRMVNLSSVKRIFCVVDGVDVCDVNNRTNLNRFLENVKGYFARHAERQAAKNPTRKGPSLSETSTGQEIEPATLPQLHMMLFSRANPSCIGTQLESFPRLELESDGSHIGESTFDEHINAKVEEVTVSCSGDKTPTQGTTEIVNQALRDGEDRSFLWVNLAAEMLMSIKQSQLKRSATEMPKTVEEIYMHILLQLPSRQRAQASTMLKWVTSAVNPLTTLELTKAIKYDLKTSFSKKTLKKVVSACHGLVRIEVQKEGKMVVLADQSVHELLYGEQSPLRENKALEDFVLEKSDVHSELANTCISYLHGSANLETSRQVKLKPLDEIRKAEDRKFLRRHPFLQYAVANWTFHAREGSLEKTNYAVPFFKEDSVRRRLWWESYWISLRKSLAWKWTAPGKFSLLHLAAFFNIVPLAQYVEQKGRLPQFIAAEDHQGMKPINWATERSQVAMVKFLLVHGDFDVEALRQAARTGEASIATMLLKNREDILRSPTIASAKSSPGASSSPFQSFRKVTLNSISDWSKKLDQTNDEKSALVSPAIPGYGKTTSETPLHIASACGHDETTEVLLKFGENFDKATDGGWTPLHNAAWFGRVTVVDILTAAGADAKAVTNEQLTALHCAVKNSQPAVVECLLSRGIVDIEAEDQFGLTPFHIACKADNIPVMEILLDYGTSIEKKMKQGWTPLMWACMHGRFAVVQTLLRRGADVCVKWVHHWAEAGKSIELGPVGLAKAYRHEDIARLVERHGAADTTRLASDETEHLPALESSDEQYDVPEVEDIVVVEHQDEPASGTLEAENSESSSESGESDDESEGEDGESRSRKQSANGSQEPVGDFNEFKPLGLGIHEEGHDATEADVGHKDSAKTNGVDQRMFEVNVVPTASDMPGSELEVQTNGDVDSSSHAVAEGTHKALSETGVEKSGLDDAKHNPVIDDQTDRRPSNPKSPGSFGEKFGRFLPRRSVQRTSSATSEEISSALEVSESPLAVVAEDGDAVAGADNPSLDSPKTEAKMFGRFGPKRGFSWKNDGGAEVKKTPSPKTSTSS